ncbi:MAG TPA: MaoC/PaaZ C-terminal domain-containing protein [Haliangiales bacterium]|nr:MaoC/PaaZ C-terminal domain-containing protein [Haliangiales bacterium]
MKIDRGRVGEKSAPVSYTYGWKDVVVYALGVGAKLDELDYLFEKDGPRVLPTFAVVPAWSALEAASASTGADPTMLLHGEHKIRLHRPIPPRGEVYTIAEVTGIYDKGKGALVTIHAETVDDEGDPVCENWFAAFVRGAGGFGGDRGAEAVRADPPDGRAPDFAMTERTLPEQAALYRLSGDLNPLHISPEFARRSGFDRPILHGLCTYGYAGRAVLRHACGGDASRLRSFAARFAGVVFPGDALTTEGWRVEPGRWVLRTKTQDGRIVLANSVAETT